MISLRNPFFFGGISSSLCNDELKCWTTQLRIRPTDVFTSMIAPLEPARSGLSLFLLSYLRTLYSIMKINQSSPHRPAPFLPWPSINSTPAKRRGSTPVAPRVRCRLDASPGERASGGDACTKGKEVKRKRGKESEVKNSRVVRSGYKLEQTCLCEARV